MRSLVFLATCLGVGVVCAAGIGGPTAPDGTEIHVDFPGAFHKHNVSSRGQGCCVFRSLHHAGVWQNEAVLHDFPEWLQQKGLAGGGYPGNVKERITLIAKDRNQPEPDYLQYEGTDLEILKLALKTNRMPAVTYAISPTGRYNRQAVRHMVNLVHLDEKNACILDNNYPGDGKYEWMTPEEFRQTWTYWGQGWAVILLNPPPPMPPRNQPS